MPGRVLDMLDWHSFAPVGGSGLLLVPRIDSNPMASLFCAKKMRQMVRMKQLLEPMV